jgi:hypothetical protein
MEVAIGAAATPIVRWGWMVGGGREVRRRWVFRQFKRVWMPLLLVVMVAIGA